MTIQLEFNDTTNFTGRTRIRQKNDLFSLRLVEKLEDIARIKIKFDRLAIEKDCRLSADEPKDYILDVFVFGEIHRHVLPEFRSEDEFELNSIPEGANLEFRLKIVSRSDATPGKILAATGGRVSLQTGVGDDNVGEKNQGIFHPILSKNLGGRIWQVHWDGIGDFEILMNADYFNKFHDNPLFAAHIYPEIVRSVASGILLRHESAEDIDGESLAGKWLAFIEKRLGIPMMGEEATKTDDDGDNATKLEIVEQIVEAFANQKWRNGKTLLEEVL